MLYDGSVHDLECYTIIDDEYYKRRKFMVLILKKYLKQ